MEYWELEAEAQELQTSLRILYSKYSPEAAGTGHLLRQTISVEVSIILTPPSENLPSDLSLLFFPISLPRVLFR